MILVKQNEFLIICFNPLKIGSYCNSNVKLDKLATESFNPLKIGSYCNILDTLPRYTAVVSIPLKSGHIVINNEILTIESEKFQSP